MVKELEYILNKAPSLLSRLRSQAFAKVILVPGQEVRQRLNTLSAGVISEFHILMVDNRDFQDKRLFGVVHKPNYRVSDS